MRGRLGFDSRFLHGDFSGSSQTQKLVLQWLPCQATGITGSAPGLVDPVSVYWLSETDSLICNFYLSVAAHTTARADPSLIYTSTLLGRQATNKQQRVVVVVVVLMVVMVVLS